MKTEGVKLVYFSPTGTTKTILQGVAKGIGHIPSEMIDVTGPAARKVPFETSENELLIVGVPVYMGRVPALLNEWLCSIRAHRTPAAGIVVYGNRAYDNALLELKDMLLERGCRPVAGAAFIGEHSYCSSETPIAECRPDASDLDHAEFFGRTIIEKLRSVSSVHHLPDLHIPGSCPYGGTTELWNVDFIAVDHACTQCGICAEGCPVGAIDPENSSLIDTEACITCCACIKNCPQNARTTKPGRVQQAAMYLHQMHNDRKEPEMFL